MNNLTIDQWCSLRSGLDESFNMNAFDIEDAGFREMFRQENGLHTYENLGKKGRWVCAKDSFRGHGETIRVAEIGLITKLYEVETNL